MCVCIRVHVCASMCLCARERARQNAIASVRACVPEPQRAPCNIPGPWTPAARPRPLEKAGAMRRPPAFLPRIPDAAAGMSILS